MRSAVLVKMGGGTDGFDDGTTNSKNTLYVNNVCEKTNKNTLKRAMHMLFSRCGKVTHIRTGVGRAGKGQMWIRFENDELAATALRDLQGFEFCGKPLRVSVAKKMSSSQGS